MADDAQQDQHKKTGVVRGVASHASDKHIRRPKEMAIPAKPEVPGSTNELTPKRSIWKRKKIMVPVAVVIVLVVLGVIPATRYPIAGLFWKKNFSVEVFDSQSGKPVSSATVMLGGKTVTTNNEGVATLHVKVGYGTLSVTKTYYKGLSEAVTVPIQKQKSDETVHLVATGRQVPLTVVDKITGKPVSNITISSKGAEAKTDSKGQVTMVLPANVSSASATLSGSGYNNDALTITVTSNVVPANTFQVTPSGKLYFLSNLSGTIDVVKTNLDGTSRQAVLGGTGNEDTNGTLLLASRDWKYLTLSSVRTAGGTNQLNLIETTNNDKVVNMDSGTNATFNPIGWIGDSFVYQVTRTNVQNWEPNAESLKSYNAQTGVITVLDNSDGSGTASYNETYDIFTNTKIVGNQLVYTKVWHSSSNYTAVSGQQNTLIAVNPDGSGKKVISSLDAGSQYFGNTVLTSPQRMLIEVDNSTYNSANTPSYYVYNDGNYTQNTDSSVTSSSFYNNVYTYLLSPSGNQTFWTEPRDGKNTLLVGDQNDQNSKQIATLSDYEAYGWYSDNYLLVTKDSAIYIMSVSGGTPQKITDYYQSREFYGYGSGYGGL